MSQIATAQNLDEKRDQNFFSWIMVCKLPRIVQFYADLSKSVKTIYRYAAESSYCALSENSTVYRDLSQS